MNLEKDTFAITKGMVLGYLILENIIKLNLEKIRSIINIVGSSTKKEVPKLAR